MMKLGPGEFFGGTLRVRRCAGLTLTLTNYPPAQSQSWHVHANPTFFLLISGDHRDVSRRSAWHQPAMTMTFHPTTELHAGEVGPAGMLGLNIEYDLSWLEQSELSVQDLGGGPPFTSTEGRRQALRFLGAAFRMDRTAETDLETQALELLEPLTKGNVVRETLASPHWMERAEDYLQQRFETPLSLRDVAREVQVHPVYFARAFRRRNGCSVSEYLRALRLAEAGRLLIKEGWPIGAAAHEAGFSDQAHLSRCFRRELGFSPGTLSALRKSFDPPALA